MIAAHRPRSFERARPWQIGPTRTRDIGLTLGLRHQSLNALMQYLKRKNAVRTQSDTRFAPYQLTPDGREMLAAMQHQEPQAAAA